MRLVGRSQGRPHFIRPTLGWRAESLWDRRSWLLRGTVLSRRRHSHPCQRSRRNSPTAFRPPPKGGFLRQRRSSLQSRLRLYANGVPSSSQRWVFTPTVVLPSVQVASLRQRRSVPQPRVARPALPWVISPTHPNPNGVASRGRRGGTPLGFMRLVGRSQGRPHFIRPTLGWRAESLWDKRSWLLRGTVLSRRRHSHPCQRSRRNSPTAFRPPAKGGVLRQRRSSLQSRLRLYANGVPSSSPG
jgi:hypothetical protein